MNVNAVSTLGKNQELNLPTGFRFDPTAFEIVQFYLIPKIKGDPLPPNFIMDLDIYKYDPHQLPFDQLKYAKEKEGYFFTQRCSEENSLSRATPSGKWMNYKANVPIRRGDEIIGFKNKFLFIDGKDPIDGDQVGCWKIVEYRCNPDMILATNRETKNLVVCKVCCKIGEENNSEDDDEKSLEGSEHIKTNATD